MQTHQTVCIAFLGNKCTDKRTVVGDIFDDPFVIHILKKFEYLRFLLRSVKLERIVPPGEFLIRIRDEELLDVLDRVRGKNIQNYITIILKSPVMSGISKDSTFRHSYFRGINTSIAVGLRPSEYPESRMSVIILR